MGKVKEELQKVFDECTHVYEEHGMVGVIDHVNKQKFYGAAAYRDVRYEYCEECCADTPALNSICLVCGQETKPHYFEIVHSGHSDVSRREEIEINAGENGKILIFQDDGKLGFIIDVYGQNDHLNSMTVWEEDLNPMSEDDDPLSEPNDPNNFSLVEIEDFKDEWGQTHDEICSNLEIDEEGAESYLMDDYFWLEDKKQWYPKDASTYSDRELAIATYLRFN